MSREEQIRTLVDEWLGEIEALAVDGDYEAAHSLEDDLHVFVLRLSGSVVSRRPSFPRYCA